MEKQQKGIVSAYLKTLSPMLTFFLIYLIVFGLIEEPRLTDYNHLFTYLDLNIPFVKYFVIPYIAWFIWIPFVCLYLLFTDTREFHRSCAMLAVGMSLFLVISIIFPTQLHLRPAELPDQDIFCRLISLIYLLDTPTNVFPSIHVFNTCVACSSVFSSRTRLFTNHAFRIFTVIITVLICLSTMLIKQHSYVDVLGAVLLFFIIKRIDLSAARSLERREISRNKSRMV